MTARHDAQYFPSSLSSFSPTTSRVCRIPLTSGTSFIDPARSPSASGTRHQPAGPGHAQPRLLRPARPGFANGQRCDDINYYGRTVAAHDLLKGREYNRNKAMEGFDEGYADVLLRPTMVGILRCGKMLPPQLNLVIEIEFADATTALWSENAGAHPAGATLSTDFEIQNVRVLASQVVLDSAPRWRSPSTECSGRSLYPTVHTQQSSVPNGAAEHNVTVARAFTKLMGVADAAGQPAVPTHPMKGASEHVLADTYDDTVRNIDIGRAGYLRHSFIAGFPTERVPKMPLSGVSTRSGDLARFTFKGLDGTMTDLFIHLVAYQLVTLSGTGVSVLD